MILLTLRQFASFLTEATLAKQEMQIESCEPFPLCLLGKRQVS